MEGVPHVLRAVREPGVGGHRDGGHRSRRALHGADITDGVRLYYPVGNHGVLRRCAEIGWTLRVARGDGILGR